MKVKVCRSEKLNKLMEVLEENWIPNFDIWNSIELVDCDIFGFDDTLEFFNEALQKSRPIFEIRGEGWNRTHTIGTEKEIYERMQKCLGKLKREYAKHEAELKEKAEKNKVKRIKEIESELKKLKGK